MQKTPQGLTSNEAKKLQEKYGKNELEQQKQKSALQIFFSQLNDWLIYVLLIAMIITFFLGEYIDAGIIFGVVIINAVLGTFQEIKANDAILALQKLSSPLAIIQRDGEQKEIPSSELVPWDIVILEAGRYIPADLELLEAHNLKIDESILTGESVPVEKHTLINKTDNKNIKTEKKNLAFMSSLASYGRGVGRVIKIGMQTEVGKIANSINTTETTKTPLEIKMQDLGKKLGIFSIIICVLMFGVWALQGRELFDMFLTSVSLAVAAIPEWLAAIVAIVLSIGVTKMSKRNAIIRKLYAVEALGSVNIICSDKTWTLTLNKMTVQQYVVDDHEWTIQRGEKNTVSEDVQHLARGMALCSDATYHDKQATGDPTEVALLLFADDVGENRANNQKNYPRIDEYPFDSDRKLMSTLHQNFENKNTKQDNYIVYTKGAMDRLLTICTKILINGEVKKLTKQHKEYFEKQMTKLSDQALRTLGLAYKTTDKPLKAEQMEEDLILIGMVGMMDPPRNEVKSAISTAKKAGITTVMITWDHQHTAFAIGKQLGIVNDISQTMSGEEIDSYDDKIFKKIVQNYKVFARVSPQHKVKIVKALKANENIVSMTGDGVNDAPSLHTAHVGIAMGITGTDVAKGASEIVLADDNFWTIVSAIDQGRNIYNNIKKAINFLLTCNLGEVLAMFVAILFGRPAPLLATQLLRMNLVTDSLPAIAIEMDPNDPEVMQQKPRKQSSGFFSKQTIFKDMLGGILIGIMTLIAFWIWQHYGAHHGVVYARTLAFMTLILAQLFYVHTLRSEEKSLAKVWLLSNKYLVGATLIWILLQIIIIYIPWTQQAFSLQVLNFTDWAIAIGLWIFPAVVNEVRKIITTIRK